ncbi:MAG: hypothetical protein QM811_19665 [Pirellulales bacterium]
MPPYHADPDYGGFRDCAPLERNRIGRHRRLGQGRSDRRRQSRPARTAEIRRRLDAGRTGFDPKDGRRLRIPAASRNIYQCFVIPTGLTEDTYITAVEFRPGNRKVVHHAILYLDDSGTARKKTPTIRRKATAASADRASFPPAVWAVGPPAWRRQRLPDDFGKIIKAGSDLALQLHYHPSGKPETDRSQLGIYFTKKKPKHLVTGIAMFNPNIRIPAGKSDYRMETKYTLPCDVRSRSASGRTCICWVAR